jgi:radical SAM-linked protein
LPDDVGPPQTGPEVRAASPPAPAAADRIRLRFRKGGDLRLLSHHDLLRCFERLLRRAELPVHRTRGFHPHPRLVFALSLPLGVVGLEEVADLELDEVLPTDATLELLRRHAPPGLEFLSAHRVPLRESAQVKALCYRLAVPPERAEEVRPRIESLLRAEELPVVRGKPQPGESPAAAHEPEQGRAGPRVNLRPFLRDLRLTESGHPPGLAVEIDLWLTPAGTAKPVEVLNLLGLADLLDAGTVLERARLELHEEQENDE